MENQTINQKEVTAPGKVVYTGKTFTTGGRDGGASRSADGYLDIKLSTPGSNRPGTNPEQLFAAGWSACFIGAMKKSAQNLKVTFPADGSVDTEVDLILSDDGYSLRARLNVSLPGLDLPTARAIADGAHQICPYSKATRGNIDVTVSVN
jgi:osmotically inducible protein OsmC